MADRLNGYRILILETREEAQFSRLLTEQGADVLQCPMFAIHDAPDPAPIEAWIRRFIATPCDDLVLMTGEGLRRLMKVVRRLGVEKEFVAALDATRKFARGPKPGRALREIGLEPQMTTEKPTSEGVAEMLSRLDLKGRRVDAIALTNLGQVRRLVEAARAHGREDELRKGLERTLIASVGPAVSGELQSHGLRTDISPANDAYFMKPLISAMAAAMAKSPPRMAAK